MEEKKKKTENWSEYCYQSKLRRIERLKEQGIVNAWGVVNGDEPRDYYIARVGREGRIMLPAKFRKQIGVGYGDKFKITIDENKLILEVYNGE